MTITTIIPATSAQQDSGGIYPSPLRLKAGCIYCKIPYQLFFSFHLYGVPPPSNIGLIGLI